MFFSSGINARLVIFLSVLIFTNLAYGIETKSDKTSAYSSAPLQNDISSVRDEMVMLKNEIAAQGKDAEYIKTALIKEINSKLERISSESIKNEANFNSIASYVNWCLALTSIILGFLAIALVFFTVDRYLKERRMLTEFKVLAEKYINENSDILNHSVEKWMAKNEEKYVKKIATTINSAQIKTEVNLALNQPSNIKHKNKKSGGQYNPDEPSTVKEDFATSEASGDSENTTSSETTSDCGDNLDSARVMFNLAYNAVGEEKVRRYAEFITHFGTSESESIQLRVARAMFNLAINSEGGAKIKCFNDLISRYNDSDNADIQLLIARAMFILAFNAVGEEKDSGYRKIISRFRNSNNVAIQLRVARAMFNLAVDANNEEKVKRYRELVANFDSNTDEAIQQLVAESMFNIAANANAELKIKECRELIARYSNSEDVDIQLLVARAMFIIAFNAKGEDKIKGYQEIIDRFGSSTNIDIQIRVARAMFNLAVDAEGDKKSKQYRTLITQFNESDNNVIQLLVARAMYNLAYNAEREDKVKLYRELIARFEGSNDTAIQLRVVRAMFNLAALDTDDELKFEGYRKLIDRFDASDNTDIQLYVARALAKLAFEKNEGDSQTLCERIIKKYGKSKNKNILIIVAMAQITLSNILLSEGQTRRVSSLIDDFKSLEKVIGDTDKYKDLMAHAIFIDELNNVGKK